MSGIETPLQKVGARRLEVQERTLCNGLRVVLAPFEDASVVVTDLHYPVGSVDDPPGRTGIAHFVEHMLFKGSARYPKGTIDRATVHGGGQSNADTTEDLTHYWFAFPAQRWRLPLDLEADRMTAAIFEPEEVEIERRVIEKERAREHIPGPRRLDQVLLTVAYLRHPYRNPIVGWPDDFARIDVGDIEDFYQTHYRPDGAVLTIAGRIDASEVFDAVEESFGRVPRGRRRRPEVGCAEPPQVGRREFTLAESDTVARAQFAWHTPPSGHADIAALDVLADLLSIGRRSRLWRRLVEFDKTAAWVDSLQQDSRRAGQFLIQVESSRSVDPYRVEGVVLDEIDDMASDGPSEAELMRVRRHLEASRRTDFEDLPTVAAGLGSAAVFGKSSDWLEHHERMMRVDADDIRRVVDRYIIEPNMTVGWMRPSKATKTFSVPAVEANDGEVELPPRSAAAARLERAESTAAAYLRAASAAAAVRTDAKYELPALDAVARGLVFHPHCVELPNKMKLIWERRPGCGIVSLEMYVNAGMINEAKPGVAHLTGRMLEEGTTLRSGAELFDLIEDKGGTFELRSTGGAMRLRSEDLELGLSLFAESVVMPSFQEERLAWVKKRVATDLQADRADPAFLADRLFDQLVYGTHPLARDPRGSVRDLNAISIHDLRLHHQRYFTSDGAVLAVVGDFDPIHLYTMVATFFRAWAPSRLENPRPTHPTPKASPRPRSRRVQCHGELSHLVLGHLGVPRNHPDFDALVVLDQLLAGGDGFADRLGRVLREELGLTYSVSGGMTDTAELTPGVFRVGFSTRVEDVEQALAVVVDQLRAVHMGAITDEEVEIARRYLAGSYVFDLQTVDQRAFRLVENQRMGLPLDEPIRQAERIARITPRQVRNAAFMNLKPDALTRVEFGPERRPGRPSKAECA